MELVIEPNTKVLHVINGENYAGAERVQDLLGAELPEFGYDVTFCCVKPDKFPAVRRTEDVPVYLTPMGGRLDFRPAWSIAKLIREHNFRLIHSHTPRSLALSDMACAITSRPHVYHQHSVTSAESTRRAQDKINSVSERFSLRRATQIIAVSNSLQNHLISDGISADRVSVVHNGVYSTGPLVRRSPPSARWIVGTVALFRPRKGLEILLNALSILVRRGREVRLRAVGEFESTDYEFFIKRMVDQLGLTSHVEWRGFRTDITAELQGMDLFVLPSLFGEGLPMAVLEAMAAGVPVVASEVEGIPEAIRDGIDGVLCRPGSNTALSEGIDRFLTEKINWQKLRESAHLRQGNDFSARSMSRGVAEVYTRVLGASH